MADQELPADHDQTTAAPFWLGLLVVMSLGAGIVMWVGTHMLGMEPWMLVVGFVVSIAVFADLLLRSRRHP